MHSAELLRLGAQALELVLRVSLPVLLASLVVGLLVGLGQATIPLDHDGEFLVVLPAGETTQDLSIALSGFVGVVSLTIALTPDTGDQILVDVDLDTGAGADATFDVPVTFPANVGTVVRVWTRPAT